MIKTEGNRRRTRRSAVSQRTSSAQTRSARSRTSAWPRAAETCDRPSSRTRSSALSQTAPPGTCGAAFRAPIACTSSSESAHVHGVRSWRRVDAFTQTVHGDGELEVRQCGCRDECPGRCGAHPRRDTLDRVQDLRHRLPDPVGRVAGHEDPAHPGDDRVRLLVLHREPVTGLKSQRRRRRPRQGDLDGPGLGVGGQLGLGAGGADARSWWTARHVAHARGARGVGEVGQGEVAPGPGIEQLQGCARDPGDARLQHVGDPVRKQQLGAGDGCRGACRPPAGLACARRRHSRLDRRSPRPGPAPRPCVRRPPGPGPRRGPSAGPPRPGATS